MQQLQLTKTQMKYGTTSNLNIINTDLYLAGDDVVIDEPTNGNVFAFADNVTVKAEINGDLFVFAKKLTIQESAIVYNNMFACATSITMAGSAYDVYAFTTNFSLEETGYIYRDLKLYSATASLNGMIKKDDYIAANQITMPEGAEKIIGGNLHYTSSEEMTFPEKAVAGEINFSAITAESEPTTSEIIASYVMKFITTILYMVCVIILATFFAPKFINKSCYVATKRPFVTAGIGILAIVLIPIVAFILIITGVLSFVGIAALAVYALVLSITLAILSLAIGKSITLKLKKQTKGKFILLSIASAAVIWLLQQVPYIGGYISLFTVVFGLGIFLFAFFSKKEIEEVAEKKE